MVLQINFIPPPDLPRQGGEPINGHAGIQGAPLPKMFSTTGVRVTPVVTEMNRPPWLRMQVTAPQTGRPLARVFPMDIRLR